MKRILFPICILMIVLIVIISAMTVSFSWFAPNLAEGSGLQFIETTSVRSQDCTFTTYSGEMQPNGIISYGTTAISGDQTIKPETGDNATPMFAYYKTVISNNNTNYDSNVSLYIKDFTVGSDSKASIAVTIPTNTYRTFTSTQNNIHIVRNAYVSAKDSSKAGAGTVIVEWFVKCDKGSVTFKPSNVYLTYN